jgi:hypothetical protein
MPDNDKILLTELYPLVAKGLSKKENTNNLKNAVSSFLDRNNEKLTTIGPIHRIIFTADDQNELFKSIEVTPIQIREILKKSSMIKSQWKIINDPFNSAMAMTIRYYSITKNKEMINACLIYFTLSMYPSLHFKYFEYEPNEQVMNYTINNLSNKYKIKQFGTIYGALNETTSNCYNHNTEKIIRGTDKDVLDFVQDVKTRLNSLIKHIAQEFYKNKADNLYLNTDSDSYDEDNYHEADSNTYAIERITNNIVLHLVVNGPDIRLINVAAKWNQVSMSELRNYLTTMIVNDNREEIKSIIESILFLYLFDSQHTVQMINSDNFLAYCLEVYKKSNTTDENIIKIKKILDRWLEDLGTYKKTQRLATINNFRRALFTFFVATIQHSNVS